jgi:cytidylate kinase
MAASNVSAIPAVREFLLQIQRDSARETNVIMDGRDIGTVILPHADIKIFLTATPEERARRRCEEMQQKGHCVNYEGLLKEIKERDFNDSNRAIAPLKPAKDAILLDNTGFVFDQSVEAILKIIRSKLDVL